MSAQKQNEVTKGTRVINLLVDFIIITVIHNLVLVIFIPNVRTNLILILIYFLYYLILEYFFGLTIGKLITNTVVLDLKKNKPSFFKILIRSLMRLNPFDTASYLFGQEQGTHDILSRTRLFVKEKMK